MMENNLNENSLERFNRRESDAFGEMYSIVYKEIYYFTYRLFRSTTIDAKDVIQDLFVKIWTGKNQFETVSKLKSFLYTSINNSFKMHYKHLKVSSNVHSQLKYENDLCTAYAVEAEIFSLASSALGMLPEDCAESFRLFLEGYSVKEIAQSMKKPISTIYSQREKAISILKSKLPKDKMLLILTLLS